MAEMRRFVFSGMTGIERDELVCGADRISLSACAINWAQAHSGSYPDPTRCRCIGERWAPGHFVLYAEEHILLVNDVQESRLQWLLNLLRIPLRLDSRRYDRFREIQQMLLDAGWMTCDMT